MLFLPFTIYNFQIIVRRKISKPLNASREGPEYFLQGHKLAFGLPQGIQQILANYYYNCSQHNNVLYTLELKLETLGNYSFDANRKQTFDCSAKKYLFEPFLQNPPTFSLIDESDSIETYKDYEMPIGWCFCITFMTLKNTSIFSFFLWGVANKVRGMVIGEF